MIEPARAADAAALARIHARCFPRREAWSAEAISIQLALPGYFGLIAAEGGMVLARTAAGEAEILTLAVVPDRRRRGLGRSLLEAAIAEAVRRDAGAMYLEVSANNHPAQGLYSAAGFVEAGRRRRYYADGTDALILRLALPPDRACGSRAG